MHGIRRVLVFCTLTTILPTMLLVIPLYLRHSFYANVAYAVTESDILEITDGISTVFCSEHTLQMNGTFNAFQMAQKPEITSYRKHIRLKKSMSLPDDTLEYWGFYLLKGATVALSVCSRFQGASILVVKGERNLRTCGMLDHNTNKEHSQGIFLPEANRQVKITFESNAQEINSAESLLPGEEIGQRQMRNISNLYQTMKNISVKSKTDTDFATTATTSTTDSDINNTNNKGAVEMQEMQLAQLYQTATSYVQKHTENWQDKTVNRTRKFRHAKRRQRKTRLKDNDRDESANASKNHFKRDLDTERHNERRDKYYLDHHNRVNLLKTELNSEDRADSINPTQDHHRTPGVINKRLKRSQELVKPPSLLDQGIMHGGNAGRNGTDMADESSVSSFENGLFNCYDGSILLAQEFEPSEQCTNVSYLLSGKHMETRHNVVEDGYYYYIFYSDNDFVSNDIHALFDIYKPTFQYENVTKSCINQTECSFSLAVMSPERVIVEIPTRDGIEHEIDDVNLLVSICHPRMGTYAIFPIAVLFLILGCAFM